MQVPPVAELVGRNSPVEGPHDFDHCYPQGLRSCIPPNFPYFAVEMGLGSGHVHVIDDESSFDAGFGRGVLIGLLQLPPEDAHRRAKQESVSAQVTHGRMPSLCMPCGACMTSKMRVCGEVSRQACMHAGMRPAHSHT